MLINNVFYTFPAERADEAAELLRELRDASRLEAGCLTFDVGRSYENTSVFVLYERYRDPEALDAHYATEHFVRLGLNGIRKLATERIGHRCDDI